jgi:hypothetical protein
MADASQADVPAARWRIKLDVALFRTKSEQRLVSKFVCDEEGPSKCHLH